MLCLVGGCVDYHHQSVALLHGGVNALAQAVLILCLHFQAVNHHLYVVVLVSVHLHAAGNLCYLAVHPYIQVAFAAHALKQLTVVSLTAAHQWGKNVNLLAFILL